MRKQGRKLGELIDKNLSKLDKKMRMKTDHLLLCRSKKSPKPS